MILNPGTGRIMKPQKPSLHSGVIVIWGLPGHSGK